MTTTRWSTFIARQALRLSATLAIFVAYSPAATALDVTTYLAAVDQPTQLIRDGITGDALAGQSVAREDRVTTGKGGNANIALGEDANIFLAANSGVLIRQLHSSGKDDGGLKGIVTVEQGMVRMESRAGARPMHLRIEQETLKVDIKDSASFMVNHNQGTDIVCLMSGEIQVQARKDRRKLKAPNTCFLYNGDTKASSVRNMEDKQVKAVLALTKVDSAPSEPRKPVVAEGSSPAPTAKPAAPVPAPVAKAPVAPAPKAPPAATKTPAPTAAKTAAPEKQQVRTASSGSLLNMMRRPAPEGVPQVTAPASASTTVKPAPKAPTATSQPVTRAPVATTRPATQPVAKTPVKTAAPTAKPAATTTAPRPIATRPTSSSKPVGRAPTAQPKTPVAVAPRPAAPVSKPATKPRKPQAPKKYPTPSGKLEQWTINLGAYDRTHKAENLVVELRKLGYRPTLNEVEIKGKQRYRLSIQGMSSRIESEAAAKEILEKTSAETYWLRNIYLTR